MDLAIPLRTLTPTLDAEVLTVLAATTTMLTGRRVAELVVRGSRPGVQKVLDRLVDHGLVTSQPAGNARLYTLNRDHLLAGAVVEAASARQRLLERLRERMTLWRVPCEHASVFGSVARGQAGLHSDIDVLVVRSDDQVADSTVWHDQLSALEEDVTRWTGNTLAWFETTPADLARAQETQEAVLQSWRDEGIHLVGQRLNLLLDRVRR